MYMTEKFVITDETCTIGFQEYATLSILKPIEEQLGRRRLVHRSYREKGNAELLKKIIDKNSSLRVSFGWSFESAKQYTDMMEECIAEVSPKYDIFTGSMVSDIQCSWLGFLPFNVFDKMVYEGMSLYSMV